MQIDFKAIREKPQTHTPTPWRIGDAGHTVFGPPNGNPSPETVAHGLNKANAAYIVRAVNAHEALVTFIKELKEKWSSGQPLSPHALFGDSDEETFGMALHQLIAKAEGK